MTGETALVTGASSGIGRELARVFASEGHDVVLVARREERLRGLSDELAERHGVATAIVSQDLATPEGPGTLIEAVDDRGITIHTLVNNAGFGAHGRFHEIDVQREASMINLHVHAFTELTKRFLRRMADRGDGAILNTVSMSALAPSSKEAVYGATKAYQLSFTEAIAHDYEDEGIGVTALCPGPVETEFYDRADFGNAANGFTYNDPRSVARAGYEGLQSGKRVVFPSTKMKAMAQVRRLLPRRTLVAMADRAVSEG